MHNHFTPKRNSSKNLFKKKTKLLPFMSIMNARKLVTITEHFSLLFLFDSLIPISCSLSLPSLHPAAVTKNTILICRLEASVESHPCPLLCTA